MQCGKQHFINIINSAKDTFNIGANVTLVAKYLGHTKIEETLKTYSHLFLSTLNEIVDVIDNLEDNKTDD